MCPKNAALTRPAGNESLTMVMQRYELEGAHDSSTGFAFLISMANERATVIPWLSIGRRSIFKRSVNYQH